jgi:hypothetical protein
MQEDPNSKRISPMPGQKQNLGQGGIIPIVGGGTGGSRNNNPNM